MHAEMEHIEHQQKLPMKAQVVSIGHSAPHWHGDYEVVFVLRGALATDVGAMRHPMSAGDLLLVNPCVVHAVTSTDRENLCLILQFDPSIISEELGPERSYQFVLDTVNDDRLRPGTQDEMRRTLARIGEISRRRPDGYRFQLKSELYRFIGDLFAHSKYEISDPTRPRDDGSSLEALGLVLKTIRERFREELTLDGVCRELGMSRSTVYRVLRNATASTFKDLLDAYRIDHAQHQLRRTASPISHIASTCGYDSDATFFRAFRRIVGVSPGQYRSEAGAEARSDGVQGYVPFSAPAADLVLRKWTTAGTDGETAPTRP